MHVRRAEVTEFCKLFRPSGPWVVTRIDSRGPGIDTALFTKLDELAKYVTKWNTEKWNCYFSVNSTLPGIDFAQVKKLKREHIASLDYLHVDVDPVGTDLAKERERIRALLEKLDPAPTFIIDSGGGYQALWRLRTPVPIGGDLVHAEDAKLYNLDLERSLGADSCHNVDRVLRLPGTVNYPDDKKRKRGRVPSPAICVRTSEVDYPIAQFRKADRNTSPGEPVQHLNPPADVKRIRSAAELDKWSVPDPVKELIVSGTEGAERVGKVYKSTSEPVWYVTCELVRCSVPDETIYAIITDPDFAISVHVLKQPRPERYAIRQIERAHEHAVDPALAEMNDRYAVLLNESGCRVMTYRRGALGRDELTFVTFADVRNAHCNRYVQEGKKKVPRGDWWLRQERRREYEGMVFEPGRDVPGYYNLWQGFGVQPIEGDWSLMQQHIREVLAGGDEVAADYLLRYAAWSVQHPEKTAEVAVALRGVEGAGKGVFLRELCGLFGQHGLHLTSMQHVSGRFNGHLRDVCFVFADEAYAPGDRAAEAIIKGLITEPTISIEAKNKQPIVVPNHVKLAFASNYDWVVPAGESTRRFAVFDVSDRQVGNDSYFAPLYHQIGCGGREAMLHDLLRMDLGPWHPRRFPDTFALSEQKACKLSGFDRFLFDALLTGELPLDTQFHERPLVSTDAFAQAAQRRTGTEVTWNAVSALLKLLGCERQDKKRPRGWFLPPLRDLRARWDAEKFRYDWPQVEGWCPGDDVDAF